MKLFAGEVTNMVKTNIASNLHRNLTSYNIDIPQSQVYGKIWSVKFDPKFPDEGGWGSCIHKTIYPLPGDNSEIVPEGAKGYMLDSTCNVLEWQNNAYSETEVFNREAGSGDSIFTSVYCFVSKEYNGESVYLNLEGTNGLISHNDYDLNSRGRWQKLNIAVKCDTTGALRVVIGFWRHKTVDFSGLKGHVIFAYPELKVLSDDLILTSDSNIEKYTNNLSEMYGHLLSNRLTQLNGNSMSYISRDKKVYYNSTSASLFYFNYLSQTLDKDPFRNWVSNFISEDTTYFPPSIAMQVDSVKDSFITMRTSRWKFACSIFTHEFSFREKIFGGGFNFLNWYGYYFKHDKTKYDYPHNPFLSVLLYSGILGLFVYLFLLYKVFRIYISIINDFPLLSIFFVIVFFFSFFSSGTPFDPPIMGFFVFLSFLVKKACSSNTCY